MKRIIAFTALMAALCGSLIAGPSERFGKFHSAAVGASANVHVIPTYHGVAFTPDKLIINFWSESGTKTCTLTIYIPESSGPETAIDSFSVYMTRRASTGTGIVYYGPTSDTMRVVTDVSCLGIVQSFGW